ncbi:hypothetical protein H1230_12885 [Paenibacillus sp. 19GGS1-52]|uniref:hypothetical protein n=1 Tax=Paenibacillus sp. 19GGS1-52 TaxID=2758563 RepID=UPI001EFC12A9|nr:hypothetical protein [Paenibacillus sp. 19GGS1-52]ULO09582.1 hypothetical protein H1230_12885 [Paenibacillus sp. 19GGS1-52]
MLTNLPAQGITTLQAQSADSRWINHLLYASPVRRGQNVEVIEDLPALIDITVTLSATDPVRKVYLAPQRTPLSFQQENGTVSYTVPSWICHQMVVLQF